MVETLHPDVFIDEISGTPTIAGVSTTTAGFVGVATKGPTDKVGLVSSFSDFARQYGTNYQNNMNLEDAVWGFFENGGQRAFIARIVGAGAVAALATLASIGGMPTPGTVTSVNAAPFDLEPGQTLVISVDGGADLTRTFTATRATRPGGAPGLPPGASSTLLIKIDNEATAQSISFAGTENTPALVEAAINAQLTKGRAKVNAGNIDIESDTRGSGSKVEITGGTALVAIGHTVGVTSGTGNVANVDAVSIAEALVVVAPVTGGAAANDGSGRLKLTSATSGAASSVQVKNSSTAVAFGFDNAVHSGSAAGAAANMFTVTALTVGAHGNRLTGTTQRWGTTTTENLANGGTQVKLTDISKCEIGDIVVITDGTTKVIVHVRSIDVGNKRIQFKAVTLGATITSGATAKTASSHRARTTLAVAGLSGDTVITVTSPSQFKVGSEVTIDDGTAAVLVRVVTKVNGFQITLNATLGAAILQGAVVALQSFDLVVKVDSADAVTYAFLSTQITDEVDYFEIRLAGETNESDRVVLEDLAPGIADAFLARPAPVVDAPLSTGDDGATPGDNDYLGSSVAPKTGLYLFDDVQSVDNVSISGITSQSVQSTLSDYATLRKDLVSINDPPLSDDQPLEVLDFRNNVLNKDTSYSALYYPWLQVRDRYAPSQVKNPQKSAAPSGFMAGVWAKNDQDDNVSVAPLNKPVLGVLGLTHFTSDGEHDLLNPAGVNVIRTFPGEGIKVMGARTLSKTLDGRHYVNIRRELLYIEKSIKAGLRSEIGRPIIEKTMRRIEREIRAFLRGLWNASMLFPQNSFEQAHTVKCDTENNPKESRDQGRLNVEVGVNCPPPAEFIVARVGLFDGTSSVEEFVKNR